MMICSHCGKESPEKEINVVTLDQDVYIDGVPFYILGIESLTDPEVHRGMGRVRGRICRPPVIVYLDAPVGKELPVELMAVEA